MWYNPLHLRQRVDMLQSLSQSSTISSLGTCHRALLGEGDGRPLPRAAMGCRGRRGPACNQPSASGYLHTRGATVGGHGPGPGAAVERKAIGDGGVGAGGEGGEVATEA
jgi:hypothetical protein